MDYPLDTGQQITLIKISIQLMDKYQRLDLRIPSNIYYQIKTIAYSTNQPLAPRTQEPSLAPIVIELIKLGLKSMDEDKHTNSNINVDDSFFEEFEANLLLKLKQYINSIVEQNKTNN